MNFANALLETKAELSQIVFELFKSFSEKG